VQYWLVFDSMLKVAFDSSRWTTCSQARSFQSGQTQRVFSVPLQVVQATGSHDWAAWAVDCCRASSLLPGVADSSSGGQLRVLGAGFTIAIAIARRSRTVHGCSNFQLQLHQPSSTKLYHYCPACCSSVDCAAAKKADAFRRRDYALSRSDRAKLNPDNKLSRHFSRTPQASSKTALGLQGSARLCCLPGWG
jgi:hypothetical protein